jgi:hypothetical protein
MHGADRGSTTLRTAVVGVMALAALGALAGRAHGHVEAAIDENNRYLKLTPMGDRLRLAYTIFIGQKPGEVLRKRLDRNRDGQIGDDEATAYGEEVARLVRPAVALTLDGRATPIDWRTVDVGLGTPSVTGSSLSIDLVGWACTGDAAAHRLVLRDTVAIDKPGETEVKLEDGPGIVFGERRIAGRAMDTLDTKWTGADGPLTHGLEAAWTVDGAAPRPADGRCRAENAEAPSPWRWGFYAVLALFAIGGFAYATRRRPRQRNVNG